MAEMDLRSYSLQVSAKFEDILKENMDSENHIKDITLLRKEIANELNSFTTELTEIAIFTGEYKLIFNTTNYWKVSYSNNDDKKFSTEYGFINPKDWYSEENIKDIERYLYAQPKAKKEGDLSGYLVDVKGFGLIMKTLFLNKLA